MATITSLDFNIGSHWDGGGVREARNDIDSLTRDLRQLNDMRATARASVDVDRTELEALNRDLDSINGRSVRAHAGVDVDEGSLAAFSARLSEIGRMRATAHVDISTDTAALTRLRTELEALGVRRIVVHVDVDVDTASARIHRLMDDFDGAGRSGDHFRGILGGLPGPIGGVGSSAQGASGGIGGLGTAVGFLVAALVLIGPVAALATAALLGGLGAGVIGLGAIVLSKTAEVKGAFASLKTSVSSEMQQAAQAMKGPLVDGINQLSAGLKQLQPLFTQAFSAAAPLIKPLVTALTNFAGSIMPGVITALRAAKPVFDGLAVGAKALGEGISAMFSGLSVGAKAAGQALGTTFSYIGQILGVVGKAFGLMADAGNRALGGLMSGLLSLVSGAMTGFVGAVRAMDGSLGPFLATVGKLVGTILSQMLPVFGQILAVMMQGLLPVLRAITPALITMGTALGGTIVAALRTLTPSLGQLAQTFGQVMIALTPLILPLTKILVAGLQVFVAVLRPLLPLIVQLANLLGLLTPVINLAAIGIGLLSKAVQAGIAWITDWSARLAMFKQVWETVWNGIKLVSDTVWNAMKVAWGAVTASFTTAWNTVSGALKVAWDAVWNAMATAAKAAWSGMQTAWTSFIQALATVWNTVSGALRTAWDTVWNAMSTSAKAIWSGMQAAWTAFIQALATVWNAVSAALKGAWDATWNALSTTAKAVWSGIQTAFQAMLNAIKAAWDAFSGAFKTATDGMLNAVKTAWSTVWNAIKVAVIAVWDALRSAWASFSSALKTATDGMLNTIKAAWNASWQAIKNAVIAVWNALRTAWASFSSALKTATDGMLNTLKAAWSNAWNAIKTGAVGAWNALRTAFGVFASAMKTATSGLMNAMKVAWDGGAKAIGAAWSVIKKLVRDPIQAVVNVVYNNGIVKLWNTVAGVFGAPTLQPFTLKNFARGGPITGPGTGTSDSIVARVSAGEHVWTSAEVQAAGGHDKVMAMRQGVMGGGYKPSNNGDGQGGFALGGIIPSPSDILGDIGGFFKNAFKVVGGVASAAFSTVSGFGGDIISHLKGLAMGEIGGIVNPLIQKAANVAKDVVKGVIPGSPWLEQLIAGGGKPGVVSTGGSNPQDTSGSTQGALGGGAGGGMIQMMADSIKNWITSHDVAVGGANVADAQKWADAQVGKPYQLGGFGSTLDCSSFMSGIAQVILGKTASPLFTTFAFTGAKQGPATFEKDLKSPFMVGVENVGVGHMAGTLNGKNYEATPPAVRSGPNARGATDPMFSMIYGMKAAIGGGQGVIPSGEHLTIIDAALSAAGVPPPGTKQQWEAGMNTLITRESNWNSSAQNNTDSNAAAGIPSKGLAQVIDPTFAANHVPGTSSNIFDPVANVAAAIRYIVRTYGNISNVQQANPNLPPKGYWNGTKSAASGWHPVGENGVEMVNFGGGGQSVRSFKDSLHDMHDVRRGGNDGGGDTDNSVNFHDGAFQFHISGVDAEECKKTMQSEEVLSKLRQAVMAGVGSKVG